MQTFYLPPPKDSTSHACSVKLKIPLGHPTVQGVNISFFTLLVACTPFFILSLAEYKDLSLYFWSEIKDISYFPSGKVRLILSMTYGLMKRPLQGMTIPLKNAFKFLIVCA